MVPQLFSVGEGGRAFRDPEAQAGTGEAGGGEAGSV